MANDKEWKRATKEYMQGNDRYNHFDVKMELSRNIRKIVKWIIIAIVVIMLLMSIMSPTLTWYKLTRKDEFRSGYGFNDIEEIAVKINMFDNGFYIYKTQVIPELEIHAVSIASKNIFIEDGTSRITKYYFEKWESNFKKNMKVEESYQDYKFGFTTKKAWLLDYKIYIDAKNEDEVLKATEAIIDFREYVDNLKIVLPCYIRIDGNVIQPIQASYQLDNEIIKNVNNEINKIN